MRDTPYILLIDDSEDDYIFTQRILVEVFGSILRLDWIYDGSEALAAIRRQSHDAYLIDQNLGRYRGLQLVRDAGGPLHPGAFILLTGQDSPEIDAEAMKAGATDYLVKGDITDPLLGRAIRYAIERKKVERQLKRLAEHDSLTGLANRTVFRSSLEMAMANTKRNDSLLAVLLLDLDHFKNVNDSLGHPIGDRLIEAAARRLTSCVRQTDTVARLGGDEFGVVATNLAKPEDIVAMAQKIAGELGEPYNLDGHQISTSSSIGVTIFPFDDGDCDQILSARPILPSINQNVRSVERSSFTILSSTQKCKRGNRWRRSCVRDWNETNLFSFFSPNSRDQRAF